MDVVENIYFVVYNYSVFQKSLYREEKSNSAFYEL
jgi:hypothetical protein